MHGSHFYAIIKPSKCNSLNAGFNDISGESYWAACRRQQGALDIVQFIELHAEGSKAPLISYSLFEKSGLWLPQLISVWPPTGVWDRLNQMWQSWIKVEQCSIILFNTIVYWTFVKGRAHMCFFLSYANSTLIYGSHQTPPTRGEGLVMLANLLGFINVWSLSGEDFLSTNHIAENIIYSATPEILYYFSTMTRHFFWCVN